MRKFFKWLFIIITGSLIIIVILIKLYGDLRKSDESAKSWFELHQVEAKIHHEIWKNKPVRFIETGLSHKKDKPLIIFVHGAPGSYDAFENYLIDTLLLKNAKLISVDRLGYGFSDYGNLASIEEQAIFINWIVDKYKHKKNYLVGHSYGGPIIAKAAVLNRNKIKGLVMVAPVIDPKNEKIFWYSHFCDWRPTRLLLSKAINIAGDEKFMHASELQLMESDWRKLDMPIVHIHGKKDQLAPVINTNFSEKNISEEYLELNLLEEGNHLLIWNEFGLVKNKILDLVLGQ